jgi:hypothetical protein
MGVFFSWGMTHVGSSFTLFKSARRIGFLGQRSMSLRSNALAPSNGIVAMMAVMSVANDIFGFSFVERKAGKE